MFLFNKRCWHPKYWALAILLAFFWLLARLPNSTVFPMGRAVGRLIYLLSKKTRRTTEVNLRLVQPGKDDAYYKAAVKECCLELGISFMETFFFWFNDPAKFVEGRYRLDGEEHWQAALAQDKGIIVLLIHMGAIDMTGIFLQYFGTEGREVVATYRDSDPVVNAFLEGRRHRLCTRLLSSTDQRGVMRALRNKGMVWYPADIEVSNSASLFAPIMGVPASTPAILPRLASSGKALVLPFTIYRDGSTYRGRVFPAFENYPSGDLQADTNKVNEAIGDMIEPQLLRYWWVIKRFKHMPDGGRRDYS
ncbi:lysophospholipid acyltransferase family protein [Agaribacterium sp. ZY112]|uniref:lysophospholipid acyltransferase family protein n=1 Tax=Agaribacterium sp. ZY112 TaxID=3233574 RepID=UPI0035243A0B